MHICLFDIDGTLVRTGGAGKAAMEAALCEEFAVRLSAEEVPYSGRTDRAIGRDLLTAHGIDPTAANQTRLVEGYLARLPHLLRRHICQAHTGLILGPALPYHAVAPTCLSRVRSRSASTPRG